jgi:hypothetical protein
VFCLQELLEARGRQDQEATHSGTTDVSVAGGGGSTEDQGGKGGKNVTRNTL